MNEDRLAGGNLNGKLAGQSLWQTRWLSDGITLGSRLVSWVGVGKCGKTGIWLQYFVKEWSNSRNADFSKQYGLKWRPENFDPLSIGTYVRYAQLDTDLTQVNQMLKSIKFGFGQCMDHACFDIRDGRMNRNEAIELVKKYDGKCSNEYIEKFCNYIDISKEEFWGNVEKFRGPMWVKNHENNWHNTIHDMLN